MAARMLAVVAMQRRGRRVRMSAVGMMRAVMRMQVQMMRRHAEMVTMTVMRMRGKARGRTGRGLRTLAPVTNASLMPFRPITRPHMPPHTMRAGPGVPVMVAALLAFRASQRFCIYRAARAERKANRGKDRCDLPHKRSSSASASRKAAA